MSISRFVVAVVIIGSDSIHRCGGGIRRVVHGCR